MMKIDPAAIIDLYNLHLKSGLVFSRTKPGERMKPKFAWVLKDGGPRQIRYKEISEGERYFSEIMLRYYGCEDLIIADVRLPEPEEREKLIAYLKRYAPHTGKYLEEAPTWFESFEYLFEFSLDYFIFRRLVNEMISGRMERWVLRWLDDNIAQTPDYHPVLSS